MWLCGTGPRHDSGQAPAKEVAKIAWHQMFHDMIVGCDVDALEKRRTKVLKAQDLRLPL